MEFISSQIHDGPEIMMSAGPMKISADQRYEFGSNWQHFIETQLTPQRLESSRKKLLTLLNRADLRGKTFLDIGSGSGLHSLAAWQSGADRVTSFDYDPQSVAATRRLHVLAGSPENWTVMRGDILDPQLCSTISPHDIVYSWGVLHHTGAMWEAIRNANRFVAENGLFCIALYTSDAYWNPSTNFWLVVKQRYNRAGEFERAVMEWWYFWRFIALSELRHFKNPFRRFQDYYQSRGMSLWTDIRDWLGGWPMEFAGIMETREFCRKELGLKLDWMSAGEACTEYVFTRQQDSAVLPTDGAGLQQVHLPGPFSQLKGKAFTCRLPELPTVSGEGLPHLYSEWVLYEEDEPLTFPRAKIRAIEEQGGGRSLIRGETLSFSTSDNSDPNTNGRRYELRRRIGPSLSAPVREIVFPAEHSFSHQSR